MKFKLLEIADFSMYWDTDAAQYGDMDMKELRVSKGNNLEMKMFDAHFTLPREVTLQ